MKKYAILLLLLTSCHPITPEMRHAQDMASCRGYGFKEGTKDFSNCMMQLDQNRNTQAIQQQQAAAMNAQATGALMTGISSMQPHSTTCTTSQIGSYGNINCR